MPAIQFSIPTSFLLIIICVASTSCSKKYEPVFPIINADTITEKQPPILSTASSSSSPFISGYYLALPSHYQKTKKNYPLLIFFHGLGQVGNGNDELPYLLNDGLGKLLKDKKFPASLRRNNEQFSFIVILPQYKQPPTALEALRFIDEVISAYRIDTTRIYLSGLSVGGTVITEAASHAPGKFAALAPIAGIDFTLLDSAKCANIAGNQLPIWIFHNNDDPMISAAYSSAFVDLINSFNPVIKPKLTVFDYYGHDAWTMALDPGYREMEMNMYEWMLSYTRK